MARPLRIEYPGAFYHVINRGQRQEAIYDDDQDRERFLSCLSRMANLFGVRLHAYCLMTNHYHLVLETPDANLSHAVQWLNVSYAVYYNRRHQYTGHLFQGRYKAILVEADTYLEALSRYVHLNPLRVDLVKRPWAYAWSSCRYFVTAAKPPDWLDVRRVLMGFGRYAKVQRKRYREYLLDSNPTNPSLDVVGGLLLGSETFSDWARKTFLSIRPKDRHVPNLDKLKPKPQVKTIVRTVANYHQVGEADIVKPGGKRNQARDIAIYLARELCGHNSQELGKHFGDISGAAISARFKHVERVMTKERKLKREIASIRSTIIDN